MLGKLFGKSTAIGLDLQAKKFFAVRVLLNDRTVEITHTVETNDLSTLAKELDRADRVITRPPPNTWYNRRAATVKGDWSQPDRPTFKERGQEVFGLAQRFTPLNMEEVLYGWKVLAHGEKSSSSEIEIHQSERGNCTEYRQALESLKLGPVHFDAWHTTALSATIPPRFTSYLLETRSPDGFAMVKNGALMGHVDPGAIDPYAKDHPHRDKLRTFLADHLMSGKGQLQAYFLNRHERDPQIAGLSCSWIGENVRELTGRELSTGLLQAFGLALSSQQEWWLHHAAEFRPGPSPVQRLRGFMTDLGL